MDFLPGDRVMVEDSGLVQIVDAALADAARRSGAWLVCKAGCSQCCVGVFAISMLDAARLHRGMDGLRDGLRDGDPARWERVSARAATAIERLSHGYPGDVLTGFLKEDDAARERFEVFANDEPCPVLDPATGTCDLYEARPMTCRVFGPPVRTEEGLGVCELCFQGASAEEIAACEMHLPEPELEESLTVPLGPERTIVAFALWESAAGGAK